MKTIKNQHGFTVLELLFIVVVIGLLAALVLSTRASVMRNQRDQQRRSDIQAISKQLENYNVENSNYPTLADLNSPTWRTANMKALDTNVLRDPSSATSLLVAKPAAKAYSYDATAADGGPCDNKTKFCAHYTLTATLEGPGLQKTFVKSSLN